MDRVEKNVRCSDDNIARVSWRTTSQASQFSFSGEQCDNFIDDRFPAVDAIIAFEGDRPSRFFFSTTYSPYDQRFNNGLDANDFRSSGVGFFVLRWCHGGITILEENTYGEMGRSTFAARLETYSLNLQDGPRAEISGERATCSVDLKVSQTASKQGMYSTSMTCITWLCNAEEHLSKASKTDASVMFGKDVLTRSLAPLKDITIVSHGQVQIDGTTHRLLAKSAWKSEVENELLQVIKIFLNIFPEALHYPDMPLMQLEADSLIFYELVDASKQMCIHDLHVVDLFSHGTLMGLLKIYFNSMK